MKLLILQHVPHEHPGYIARYAERNNITLDVMNLWKPARIPAATGYAGIIILGGPMGVYDDFPSKAEELALIEENLGKTPLLGICLGSQLLAHALGAKVQPNSQGKEIGYYSLDLTEQGKQSRILQGFASPMRALEWHGDAFDLPPRAELLATSPLCTNQAFSFRDSVFGLLFHFEFTPDMVQEQIKIDKEYTHQNFELDEQRLITEASELAGLMEEQCSRLLDNFLRR